MKNNEEIVGKIREAVLDMMSKVEFVNDKRQHRYQLKSNGNWLQGVSTVSSIIPKDWLSAWGAKECAKFLGYSDYEGDTERAKEVMEMISQMKTPEELIELLKEAKGASGRKSKTALVDGKKGHDWLEIYVKAKIRNQDLPEIPDGTLERPIKQFLAWEEKEIKQWILSEARVAYPEKGYAGTMDAMAILKNGKLAVIDFKFASHISEDYYLQTAGYGATFEPYGIKVEERVIVRLPKTLQREEYDEKTHKYKMVDNNLEVEIVKTNYEVDKQVFFSCLPVKSWINQFKKK
jgi:hypothetical protein